MNKEKKNWLIINCTMAVVFFISGIATSYVLGTNNYIDLLEKKNALLEKKDALNEEIINAYKKRETQTIEAVLEMLKDVFVPKNNSTITIKPMERYSTYYNSSNDTFFEGFPYMFSVNNSNTFYFIKNAPDEFYIEDISKQKPSIFERGNVSHVYYILQGFDSMVVSVEPMLRIGSNETGRID